MYGHVVSYFIFY